MDVKNPLNPWSVEDVDVFLFYCCPQCDHRTKSKASFIEHAFLDHPESKENVKTENLKIEPFLQEAALLVNIKEEETTFQLEQTEDLDYLFEEDEEEDQPLVKKKRKKKVVKKEKEIIEEGDDDKEYQCYR